MSFILIMTSSNQRLGECVQPKMDGQAVAKDQDCQHTMPYYASLGGEEDDNIKICVCINNIY